MLSQYVEYEVSNKNLNKFPNNSGGEIHRSLQYTFVDTYEKIQVANKRGSKGKLPGLVVCIKDSQFEPWSLDVSSIPGFA
jgi:hypothetical protein